MMRPSRARRRVRALARLLALATGALLLLALPSAAAAHSELERSIPTDGATVPSPFDGPVVLEFAAALANGSKAELTNPGGVAVAAATVDGPDATMTFVLDAALVAGDYRVEWTSIATDGDLLRGILEFTVAPAVTTPTPAPTPEPTPAPTASATAPSATSAPETSAPASSVPSASPRGSPSAGSDTSGGSADVVLPIIVALLVVGAGAAYLLTRRNRPTAPG